MENRYPWMNNLTGEVNATLWEAIKSAIFDFIHCPKCRTIKIFSISKTEE